MANDKAIMGRALIDARTLLIHVQRKGTIVDKAVVRSVLDFGDAYAKDTQTVDQEEGLLLALATLSKLAQPASIDGIEGTDFHAAKGHSLVSYILNRASFGKFPKDAKMPPMAFESALAYAGLAMVILLLLLLLLLSTTTQLALFQTLRLNEAKIAEIEAKQDDSNQRLEVATAKVIQAKPGSDEYRVAADAVTKEKEAGRRLGNQLQDANEDWSVTVEVLLSDRSSLWYAITYPFQHFTGKNEPSISSDPVPSNQRKYTFTQIRLGLIERLAFFIPALAAYLGALAYALRGIAKEIVEDSFTEESRMQYRLRTTLAPLLGIAAGMMAGSQLVPTQAAALQQVVESTVSDTISIAAVAVQFTLGFVVGYSIEVVFAIVDKIISGFKQ